MQRGFAKVEETADRYSVKDCVNGEVVGQIKKTGSKFNAAAEEAKMVQKIRRAYADYISELHHRKTNC